MHWTYEIKPCSHCGSNGNFGPWNAIAMWTPPFNAIMSICDVSIWRQQNNENYAVAVAAWTGSYSKYA